MQFLFIAVQFLFISLSYWMMLMSFRYANYGSERRGNIAQQEEC